MQAEHLILFDDPTTWRDLLPLTFTRPAADLRVGIFRISEKWEQALEVNSHSIFSEKHLERKFPFDPLEDNLWILGSVMPTADLVEAVNALEKGEALVSNGKLIAGRIEGHEPPQLSVHKDIPYEGECLMINYPWEVFQLNGRMIKEDISLFKIKQGTLHEGRSILMGHDIYVESGAKVPAAILNTETGPIYIGKDVEIMEGAMIQGPFAALDNSVVKMGAKIYGATTLGPHSKVGGEINNSVIQGYSNKAHDGFLGNSVLGEWCNLGADTNNSNLKNNYAEVKVWNYNKEGFSGTGSQFAGLIMGDHSKSGINTMFNTGTVVGVSSNVFGSGFPRNFIPSFSWGGASGMITYRIDKALETAALVLERRGKKLDMVEEDLLKSIFDLTAKYRKA